MSDAIFHGEEAVGGYYSDDSSTRAGLVQVLPNSWTVPSKPPPAKAAGAKVEKSLFINL